MSSSAVSFISASSGFTLTGSYSTSRAIHVACSGGTKTYATIGRLRT
jgi:hypothetical protein